jgi:hypothetical protein
MDTIFSVVGWILGLLFLPHFVAVAFARYIGIMAALNHVHPAALDSIDRETDFWSRSIGAGVAFEWLLLGGYWASQWGLLRWPPLIVGLLVLLVWFGGVRAIKRKLGLL